MVNLNKCTKTKPKPTLSLVFKNCSYVCVSLCTTVVHNTAQNSSDSLILIAQTMSTERSEGVTSHLSVVSWWISQG